MINMEKQEIKNEEAVQESKKLRLVAFLLCTFFGGLGIHRFYVGKVGTGLLMMFTLGGFGLWTLIDWILILAGVFTDAEGNKIVKWSN